MLGPVLRAPLSPGPAADGTAAARPAPAATIVRGELLLNGVSTYLYGGELQYFRVRDASGDAAKTHAMWAETLDAMVAAKMNLVTTYVPWDYHATAAGTFSFEGTRDLSLLLAMCKERGLRVVLKPGPLITAEWPRGFGTFGAVPAWWKAAHPEALEKKPGGAWYTFGNNRDQAQPTLLHPTYLAAVGEFYQRFADVARPYLGDTVIAVQIDNETNHYWASPFGGPGYSQICVDFWRAHLRATYGTIAKLNTAYGTRHASFASVEPPTREPKKRDDPAQNPWLRDWYDAGQRYIVTYLEKLRGMLESTGIREPQVLFFVNDSPFTLSADRFQIRNVRLPDGSKRKVGRLGLDIYPKWLPGGFAAEFPWQADYFARRFSSQTNIGDNEGEWLFGAELQAGNPVHVGPFPVGLPAHATDQLMARAVGRGVKASALYVMRDGLNADGSKYDFGGPLDIDGNTTPRYAVVKRWGAFLARHGADLQRSHEVTNRVAILVNERHAVPQAGVRDNLQMLHTRENAAVFGWLTNAGLNPVVVDATTATAADLARYAVVIAQNPDVPDTHVGELLRNHPGTVVSLLGPGKDMQDGVERDLAGDYGVVRNGGKRYWIPYIDGKATYDLEGETGRVRAHRRAEFFAPVQGSRATPFMWNGKRARDDQALGWINEDGAKKRVLIGTDIYAGFNYLEYYYRRPSAFEDAARLARQLVKLGGESPIVSTGKVREIAWARRSDEAVYLFCVNDNRAAVETTLRIDAPDRLGLRADRMYEVHDALGGGAKVRVPGAALLADGLRVPLAAYGTAVMYVRECAGETGY